MMLPVEPMSPGVAVTVARPAATSRFTSNSATTDSAARSSRGSSGSARKQPRDRVESLIILLRAGVRDGLYRIPRREGSGRGGGGRQVEAEDHALVSDNVEPPLLVAGERGDALRRECDLTYRV